MKDIQAGRCDEIFSKAYEHKPARKGYRQAEKTRNRFSR